MASNRPNDDGIDERVDLLNAPEKRINDLTRRDFAGRDFLNELAAGSAESGLGMGPAGSERERG